MDSEPEFEPEVDDSEPESEGDGDDTSFDADDDMLASQQRKDANAAALLKGDVKVVRAPLLPRLLKVDPSVVLRRAFISPLQGAPAVSVELKRRLASRQRFIPWGSKNASSPPPGLKLPMAPLPAHEDNATEEIPPDVEPLILWTPKEDSESGAKPISVDPMLLKWLRQHQREGVQFCFEINLLFECLMTTSLVQYRCGDGVGFALLSQCITGLREFGGQGCILADDMGLGKTLQGITLLWTVLKQGFSPGKPLAKRIVIVCPTSLVSNWDQECEKFLKGRVRTLPLSESSRQDCIDSIRQFLMPHNPYHVLIVSYETFRIHAERFTKEGSCDLLICDEAHRLKNADTQTNKALDSLPCKSRVLLSGTPLQNDLGEFYAMITFCNPGVLGRIDEFNKRYANPILRGREPDSTDDVKALGQERSNELSMFVNQFIIRRTNSLLSAHLPPKVVEIVCCKLTELQEQLYLHFLASKTAQQVLNDGRQTKVLPAINALRKLCNQPKLIYDMINAIKLEKAADGFQDCEQFFLPGMFDDGRPGRGRMSPGWEMLGGKFALLARMLQALRETTRDRIVIVSNFTQTLGLVAQLCRERSYPFVTLDGSTGMSKRKKLVKQFNDPAGNEFVFLLSSKAGGCGLNLIGGNRLVLFDPDWNPANDKQAAARVWRDGQKKRVFVYRFLSTGTLEEKIFQRQLSKEGLKSAVDSNEGGELQENTLPTNELRKLFYYNSETASDCHDGLRCTGCVHGESNQVQIGKPSEEDLKAMGHHSSVDTVPDSIMQRVGGKEVSYVFTCEVAGKEIETEEEVPTIAPRTDSASIRERRIHSTAGNIGLGSLCASKSLASGAGNLGIQRSMVSLQQRRRPLVAIQTPVSSTGLVRQQSTPLGNPDNSTPVSCAIPRIKTSGIPNSAPRSNHTNEKTQPPLASVPPQKRSKIGMQHASILTTSKPKSPAPPRKRSRFIDNTDDEESAEESAEESEEESADDASGGDCGASGAEDSEQDQEEDDNGAMDSSTLRVSTHTSCTKEAISPHNISPDLHNQTPVVGAPKRALRTPRTRQTPQIACTKSAGGHTTVMRSAIVPPKPMAIDFACDSDDDFQ